MTAPLDNIGVNSFLTQIGKSHDEEARCRAARELCQAVTHFSGSLMPRGNSSRCADTALSAAQEHDILRLLEASSGELRCQLLMSLGYVGGAAAVPVIRELTRRRLDDATLGTAIYTLGQLGGPQAVECLDDLSRRVRSDLHRTWIESAKKRIATGGRVDFAEGLVEVEPKGEETEPAGAISTHNFRTPTSDIVYGPEVSYATYALLQGVPLKKWTTEGQESRQNSNTSNSQGSTDKASG